MKRTSKEILRTIEIVNHFRQFYAGDKMDAARAIAEDEQTRKLVTGCCHKRDLVEVIRWLTDQLQPEPVAKKVITEEVYKDGRKVCTRTIFEFEKGIEIEKQRWEGGEPDGGALD